MQGNSKIFNIVLISLLGISGLLYILFIMDVVTAGLLLNWCYLLLGAAVLVSIIFPLIVMVRNPKKAKSALIGVVALLVVFGIGYGLAGEETYKVGELTVGEAVSRRSEAGLIAFYILIFGAVAAIVYSEVSKAFK